MKNFVTPRKLPYDIGRAVYHFAIYIQANEIHNVVALIKFLLALRCQLYMFRTVTVHPQELLCRYCMCRLWYVVRSALPDTSSWYRFFVDTVCADYGKKHTTRYVQLVQPTCHLIKSSHLRCAGTRHFKQ